MWAVEGTGISVQMYGDKVKNRQKIENIQLKYKYLKKKKNLPATVAGCICYLVYN